MTDLGLFLGAAMASAAHARRMADEEALAIAEYYASTPGLSGMSVPRMRMPEITLELPVLVEQVDDGEDERPAPSSKVREAVLASIGDFVKTQHVPLNDDMVAAIDKEVARKLDGADGIAGVAGAKERRTGMRQAVSVAVEDAVGAALKKLDKQHLFKGRQDKDLQVQLGKAAAAVAVEREGRSPQIRTTVITDAVKNHADAANVARMRVTLREEGLEWSSYESDGIERARLTPE